MRGPMQNTPISHYPELTNEGRVPPQAIEVEESILGSLIIDFNSSTEVLEMLRPHHLYKPANRHIYECIMEMYMDNKPVDLLTIESELSDRSLLDFCGGPNYLSDLTATRATTSNLQYYAQIVIEKSIKREIILRCTEAISNAYDSTTDTFDVLEKIERGIMDVVDDMHTKQAIDIADGLETRLEEYESLRGSTHEITGVPTGLVIDGMTSGWQKGDLIIIAGRPSMGKTAFVLTSAINAASHNDPALKTGVGIFSLEMSAKSLQQRFITMKAKINGMAARKGKITVEQFESLIHAAGFLSQLNIKIDDTPQLSLLELRSKAQRMVKREGIGLIVIDYLQLMRSGLKDHTSSREQEIAYISRGLKALAKELDIPVVALAQLSRAVETRGGDKRPILSDLRESGQIEQDADVVGFLYRPEYYGQKVTAEGESTSGIAEFIIAKQRNGPVGYKDLLFIKDHAAFYNLSTENRMIHNTKQDDEVPF